MNAHDIKAAAQSYNVDYPEAAAEIEAGVAGLLIIAGYCDRYGRKVQATVDYGVRAVDGGWIGSGTIGLEAWRSLDGRVGPDKQAERKLAGVIARAKAAGLPVEVRRARS